MYVVRPITAEHSPTARPAELHKVKPGQLLRTSGPVLNVDWLRTSSGTEKSSNLSPIQTAVLRQKNTRNSIYNMENDV